MDEHVDLFRDQRLGEPRIADVAGVEGESVGTARQRDVDTDDARGRIGGQLLGEEAADMARDPGDGVGLHRSPAPRSRYQATASATPSRVETAGRQPSSRPALAVE